MSSPQATNWKVRSTSLDFIPQSNDGSIKIAMLIIIALTIAAIAGLGCYYAYRQPRLTMQSWDDCAAYPTPTGADYTPIGNLIDARDGKSYEIRKFSDGKCWMVDNLRYGGVVDACAGKSSFSGNGSTTATNQFGDGTYGDCRDPAASGESGSKLLVKVWTIFYPPATWQNGTVPSPCLNSTACGYYYNWQGAMQDPDAYFRVIFTTPAYPWQGICPTGWHIPKGGVNNDDTSEFVRLANCAEGNCAAIGDGIQNGFFQPGFNWKGLYSGYSISSGSLLSQGSLGLFWSSVQVSASSAYYLFFISSSVYPASTFYGKNFGFAVRCVKD
jgi:uncharacterized protein (TIGR02145 family)